MPKIDHPNIGDIAKTKYIKGVIVSTDGDNDTAEVDIEGQGVIGNIPIFYHCEEDSVERENGALEGGSGAFAEDDEIIVQSINGEMKIIGHADGVKRACAQGWQFKVRDFNFDSDVDAEAAVFIADPSAPTPWNAHVRTIIQYELYFEDNSFAMQVDHTRQAGIPLLEVNQFSWQSPTGFKTLSLGGGDDLSFINYSTNNFITTINTKHPSFLSQVELDIPAGNTGYYLLAQTNFRYESTGNPPGFVQRRVYIEYPDVVAFTFTGELINEGPVFTFPYVDEFLLF